jgi:hypothetical protein
MSKNDGGPAFARPFSKSGDFTDSPKHGAQEGLSIRDYFAAKAMQAVIAKSSLRTDEMIAAAATASYGIADAMLAERAK